LWWLAVVAAALETLIQMDVAVVVRVDTELARHNLLSLDLLTQSQ
jgi:hypothetical protein